MMEKIGNRYIIIIIIYHKQYMYGQNWISSCSQIYELVYSKPINKKTRKVGSGRFTSPMAIVDVRLVQLLCRVGNFT